jgi:hypothetical protein
MAETVIQIRIEGQLRPVPFLVLVDGEPVPMEPPKIEQVAGSRSSHLLPAYERKTFIPMDRDSVYLDVIEEIPFTDLLRRTMYRVR